MNWPTNSTELSIQPSVFLDVLKQYATTQAGNPDAAQVVTHCNNLSADQAVNAAKYTAAATFVYEALDEPPNWANCAIKLQSADNELNPPLPPPGG